MPRPAPNATWWIGDTNPSLGPAWSKRGVEGAPGQRQAGRRMVDRHPTPSRGPVWSTVGAHRTILLEQADLGVGALAADKVVHPWLNQHATTPAEGRQAMKAPMPPPSTDEILERLTREDSHRLVQLFSMVASGQHAADSYMPWDDLRYRNPPDGFTHEEWWFAVKFARRSMRRVLPLVDPSGKEFTYVLPDAVLRGIEDINRAASGNITISEQVTNPATSVS